MPPLPPPVSAATILGTLDATATRMGQIAETWAFQADSERSYHFRADAAQIDEMLTLIVSSTLIFGNLSQQAE
jgi:hypothetical protein